MRATWFRGLRDGRKESASSADSLSTSAPMARGKPCVACTSTAGLQLKIYGDAERTEWQCSLCLDVVSSAGAGQVLFCFSPNINVNFTKILLVEWTMRTEPFSRYYETNIFSKG